MIDKRSFKNCSIGYEMNETDLNFWFDFKKKKFLHNVDTFYYSVKMYNDFTVNSEDDNVKYFRDFFERKQDQLQSNVSIDYLPIRIGEYDLNLRPGSFAGMYKICLECPEWFDIFIAPVVPSGSDGGQSLTCELIIQVRSYMLWMYGVYAAFDKSYLYVQALADRFDLQIDFVQENRVDYCWHSNYLSNPEKFFSLDNFYKMRVDRFHDAMMHTEKVGSAGYEIDYIALGKRSDKVFIRIYLKSKEVVEQGYKGWFLYTWLFHGLINRYDLYVYEECYKRRSWKYLNMARLNYYLDHGLNESSKETCRKILAGDTTISEDSLQKLADSLTPKVNLIMNVEYQTMRRHTKSYPIIQIRDHSDKGPTRRIYEYFDEREMILKYLTHDVFRLVEPEGDTNKSRRDMCSFWLALRNCRLIDVHKMPKHLKFVRQYNRNLNGDLVKTRAINSMVSYGLYTKGLNSDDVMKDAMDTLCRMNDNDVQKALRYKKKRTRQLNRSELSGSMENVVMHDFALVSTSTGEIYEYDTINADFWQGGNQSE